MIGYDNPLLGARARRVWYNGSEWISVLDRGGFWSDVPSQRWTNVIQGFNGLPRVWGIRLLPIEVITDAD